MPKKTRPKGKQQRSKSNSKQSESPLVDITMSASPLSLSHLPLATRHFTIHGFLEDFPSEFPSETQEELPLFEQGKKQAKEEQFP